MLDASDLTEDFYKDKTIGVHIITAGKAPFRTITSAFINNGESIIKLDGSHNDVLLNTLNGAKTVVTTQSKELMEVLCHNEPAQIRLYDNGVAYSRCILDGLSIGSDAYQLWISLFDRAFQCAVYCHRQR